LSVALIQPGLDLSLKRFVRNHDDRIQISVIVQITQVGSVICGELLGGGSEITETIVEPHGSMRIQGNPPPGGHPHIQISVSVEVSDPVRTSSSGDGRPLMFCITVVWQLFPQLQAVVPI